MLAVKITEQELHTILAALRYFQQKVIDELAPCSNWIRYIATNGGQVKALNGPRINELCERINIDYEEIELEDQFAP